MFRQVWWCSHSSTLGANSFASCRHLDTTEILKTSCCALVGPQWTQRGPHQTQNHWQYMMLMQCHWMCTRTSKIHRMFVDLNVSCSENVVNMSIRKCVLEMLHYGLFCITSEWCTMNTETFLLMAKLVSSGYSLTNLLRNVSCTHINYSSNWIINIGAHSSVHRC